MKGDHKKLIIYIISFVIFAISFLSAYCLQANQILKGFIALPGVVSLLTVLHKAWKDEQLQNERHDFALGTASHMAEVAYDKHVLFCEKYIERLQKGLQEIYRDGPSKNSMNIGRDLVNIRQEHSAWLTKEIERKLRPIETALIEMGAREHLLDHQEAGEQRNATVERVYRLLGLILGHEGARNEEESKCAIDEVIEIIRDILGIEALTALRVEATKIAIERLRN